MLLLRGSSAKMNLTSKLKWETGSERDSTGRLFHKRDQHISVERGPFRYPARMRINEYDLGSCLQLGLTVPPTDIAHCMSASKLQEHCRNSDNFPFDSGGGKAHHAASESTRLDLRSVCRALGRLNDGGRDPMVSCRGNRSKAPILLCF